MCRNSYLSQIDQLVQYQTLFFLLWFPIFIALKEPQVVSKRRAFERTLLETFRKHISIWAALSGIILGNDSVPMETETIKNYYMLVTLHESSEVSFPLIGTTDFHVKAENERFTAAGSSCRQNVQFENFTSLLFILFFDYFKLTCVLQV